jgi:ribosomal protein S18 acetylase RimI-like enzyme
VSWFRSSLRRRSAATRGAAPPEREEEQAAPVVAVASRAELEGRSLADLHALAHEHGIPRYRLLRKNELIGALAGEPTNGGTAATAPAPPPERKPAPPPERKPEPASSAGEIRVREAREASIDLLDAVQHLVGQLSSSASKPGAADLEEIIESPVTRLLVARDGNEVVGMLTLVLFRIPTGVRAWIEDVVVDEGARGRGAGQALTNEAIRIADGAGARTVDLTSRREREAANRMYQKLGFAVRETTVYRIDAG